MRVVSGSARGCRLQPVPGMNTRPTTDRVKENVFNLIQDHVRDADVLDLFAGTGQLGIEALSRGAAHCDFIEHNGTAYSVAIFWRKPPRKSIPLSSSTHPTAELFWKMRFPA